MFCWLGSNPGSGLFFHADVAELIDSVLLRVIEVSAKIVIVQALDKSGSQSSLLASDRHKTSPRVLAT